jgi:hypothetical protein
MTEHSISTASLTSLTIDNMHKYEQGGGFYCENYHKNHVEVKANKWVAISIGIVMVGLYLIASTIQFHDTFIK